MNNQILPMSFFALFALLTMWGLPTDGALHQERDIYLVLTASSLNDQEAVF